MRNKTYQGKHKDPSDYGELFRTHRKWAWLDYKLYDFFMAELKNSITDKVKREVTHFRDILQKVSMFCYGICKIVTSKNFKELLRYKLYNNLTTVKAEKLCFPKHVFTRSSIYLDMIVWVI